MTIKNKWQGTKICMGWLREIKQQCKNNVKNGN